MNNNIHEQKIFIGLLKKPVKYVKIEVIETDIENQFMNYFEKKKTAFKSGLYSMVTFKTFNDYFDSEESILKELNASLLNDKNHVNAINIYNDHITRIYNNCFDFIKNNELSFKNDGSLYNKSYVLLTEFIDPLITSSDIKYYINSDKYSLKIDVRISYKIGLSQNGRINQNVYIYDNMNNKQDDFRDHTFEKVTLSGYKKAKKDIKKHQKKIDNLESQISGLKFKYNW